MNKITETAIERYTAEELENRGFQFLQGATIVPDGEFPERQVYSDVLLSGSRFETCPNSISAGLPWELMEMFGFRNQQDGLPLIGRKIYE